MNKIFIICIALTIFLASCQNQEKGNPTEVFTAFTEAMVKKDFVTAKKYCTVESQMLLGMLESFGENMGEKELEKFDKSKVEFGTAIINGDNAKVPIKDKVSKQSIDFPMKKVNGEWKVAFDMQSMVNMGTDKMKKDGMDMKDTIGLSEKLNELKNMNIDSMMKSMKKLTDTTSY